MTTPLVEALICQDRASLERVLDTHVAFHSPVRTYRERDQVVHLLILIGGLLDSTSVLREVWAGDETVTVLAGRVGEEAIEGALDERRAPDGRVTEVTLMLRPLKTLLVAVERMSAALATP